MNESRFVGQIHSLEVKVMSAAVLEEVEGRSNTNSFDLCLSFVASGVDRGSASSYPNT